MSYDDPRYCTWCGKSLPEDEDYVRPLQRDDPDGRYETYCPSCGWSGKILSYNARDRIQFVRSQEAERQQEEGPDGSGGVVSAGWRAPVDGADGAPEFPYIRTPLYGEIPAPSSLDMLLRYVENVRWARPWLEGWRGQANVEWKLDSTAARRLNSLRDDFGDLPGRLRQESESFEDEMRDYERRLLDRARMAGHGMHGGRTLTDLELLSVLQHYGAATRLLDFSRNLVVALWFACMDGAYHDRHGLLVGIESHVSRRVQTETDLETPIPRLVDGLKPDEQYCFWEPRHLFERMRVQQSLFVFGPTAEQPWGSAPFGLYATGSHESEGEYEEGGNPMLIAVPPSLKEKMSELGGSDSGWRNLFGYDGRSLFPDIEGFSAYHGATQALESEFFIVGRERE